MNDVRQYFWEDEILLEKSVNGTIKAFEALIRQKSSDAPRADSFWTEYQQLSELSLEEFMTLSAAAPRRLGRTPLTFDEAEKELLLKICPELENQNCGNLGRLLLAAVAPTHAMLQEMITRGGDDEQAMAITALNFREDAADYKNYVVHACRTNSTVVHSAVSQNNIYASRFFDDQEFKQLTIKTIFLGLDFEKISGLENRFNGELGQSLTDFFDERRAAGRWLPESVLEFMKRKGLLK